MIAAALTLLLSIPGPCSLGAENFTVVEVWYSDAPFGMPWIPTWVPAIVFGNRLYRLDGRGYFTAQHVREHLQWRAGDKR